MRAAAILLILLASAALGSGVGSASAQNVVCGDRLCSEVPGGHSAWKEQMATEARETIERLSGSDEAEGAAGEGPHAGEAAAGHGAHYEIDPIVSELVDEGIRQWVGIISHQAFEPTMTELAENVYHYFGGGFSTLVVVSEDDVLITDTGIGLLRTPMMKESIAEITDVPVTKIVLTHEHYDHVGGTEVFEDAEIICHASCQAAFDLDVLGTAPEKVDTEFDDFLSIDIGGIEVQLHHFGPADGEATTIIYLPAEQILVSSDLYSPGSLPNGIFMEDYSYLGVREIYRNIADWEITHAVNSHSPGTDPADLRAHMEFVEDLYEAVYAPMKEAQDSGDLIAFYTTIAELPYTLELEKYAGWDGYDEQFPKHVQRMILAMFHAD